MRVSGKPYQGRLAAVTAMAAAGAALALALAGGTPASGVSVTSVSPVPLVPGAEGRTLLDAVSAGDLARLLVTVLPGEAPASSGAGGVYVVDAGSNAVTPVVVPPGDAIAVGAAISPNGRFVLYGLDPTGTFEAGLQLFLKDLQTDLTTEVSVSSAEVAADGASFGTSVSDDGRYVVFDSLASNLAPGDGGTGDEADLDVFLRDTVAGTTLALSDASATGDLGCASPDGPDGSSSGAALIVFSCVSADFEPTSFSYDRAFANRTQLTNPTGEAWDVAAVSADGKTVVLVADQAPPGEIGPSDLVILTAGGTTTSIPFDLDATLQISRVDLSADGRYVLFEVVPSSEEPSATYVHDRVTGATVRVSEDLPEFSGRGLLAAGDRVYFSSGGETTGGAAPDALVVGFRPFVQPAATSARSGFVPQAAERVASNVAVGKQGFGLHRPVVAGARRRDSGRGQRDALGRHRPDVRQRVLRRHPAGRLPGDVDRQPLPGARCGQPVVPAGRLRPHPAGLQQRGLRHRQRGSGRVLHHRAARRERLPARHPRP